MKLEQCINFLLSKAQHTVLQSFKQQLTPYNVTPAQYGVLNCLWENGALSPGEIAEKLSIDGSTMSGILTRMEQKELLIRQPDPKDRRAVRVVLRPKGNEAKEQLLEAIEQANEKVLKSFSAEEVTAFKNFLLRISSFQE